MTCSRPHDQCEIQVNPGELTESSDGQSQGHLECGEVGGHAGQVRPVTLHEGFCSGSGGSIELYLPS